MKFEDQLDLVSGADSQMPLVLTPILGQSISSMDLFGDSFECCANVISGPNPWRQLIEDQSSMLAPTLLG